MEGSWLHGTAHVQNGLMFSGRNGVGLVRGTKKHIVQEGFLQFLLAV